MPDTEDARALLERQAIEYRARAEDFRTVCEGTRSPTARRALLALAATADEMAAKIEAQARALDSA